MRKLDVLLAVWCVLVVAPGVAVAAGAFGDVYFHWRGARLDNAGIPAGATVAWIVGYLAELLLFMYALRVAGRHHILGWIAAIVFPFGVNWTVHGEMWLAVIWFVATAAIALSMSVAAQRAEALQRYGVRAKGVVLEVLVPVMNVVVNNVYIKRKVRLRIERDDGVAAYEGVLDGTFMLGKIPSVGDAIALRVDPKDPQRFEEARDHTSSREEERPRR